MLDKYLQELAREQDEQEKVASRREAMQDYSDEDLLQMMGQDKAAMVPPDLQLPEPPPAIPPGNPPTPEAPPEIPMGEEPMPEEGMEGAPAAEIAADDATMPIDPQNPTPGQIGAAVGTGVGALLGMLMGGLKGMAPGGMPGGPLGGAALGGMAGAGAGALGGAGIGAALGSVQQGMNMAVPPAPQPMMPPAGQPALGGAGMQVNPPGFGSAGAMKMGAAEEDSVSALGRAGAGVTIGGGAGWLAGYGMGLLERDLLQRIAQSSREWLPGLMTEETLRRAAAAPRAGARRLGLAGAGVGALGGLLHHFGKQPDEPEEKVSAADLTMEDYESTLLKLSKGPMPPDFETNKEKVVAAQDPTKPGAEKPDLKKEAVSPLQAGLLGGGLGAAAGAGGLLAGRRLFREAKETRLEDQLKDLPGPLGEFYRSNPERLEGVADYMSRMPPPQKTPLGTQSTVQFQPVSDPMLEYIDQMGKTSAWQGKVPEDYAKVLEKAAGPGMGYGIASGGGSGKSGSGTAATASLKMPSTAPGPLIQASTATKP